MKDVYSMGMRRAKMSAEDIRRYKGCRKDKMGVRGLLHKGFRMVNGCAEAIEGCIWDLRLKGVQEGYKGKY